MNEITYKIVQRTTAPEHAVPKVIERMQTELELQFGSTITVTVKKVKHRAD